MVYVRVQSVNVTIQDYRDIHVCTVNFPVFHTNLAIFFCSEMGTLTLENILLTRCTALGFINLPMGTATRGPGMRVEGKGLECTHSETARHNLVTGKMEFLTFQAHRIQRTLYLLLLSIIPKYSMQCRYFLFACIIVCKELIRHAGCKK